MIVMATDSLSNVNIVYKGRNAWAIGHKMLEVQHLELKILVQSDKKVIGQVEGGSLERV